MEMLVQRAWRYNTSIAVLSYCSGAESVWDMCMYVHVWMCIHPWGCGWYVRTATLGMPRMWEVARRNEGLCRYAPDGRSRFSDWLVPGGRRAVGVLSLLWRKVKGQLPLALSFLPFAQQGSSSLDESHEVRTKLLFLLFEVNRTESLNAKIYLSHFVDWKINPCCSIQTVSIWLLWINSSGGCRCCRCFSVVSLQILCDHRTCRKNKHPTEKDWKFNTA